MLAKKNRTCCGVLFLLLCAVFLAGCSPPGPRALFKGKKLLDRGDYAGAVAELQKATTLLATNAQAWNYLGVACQGAGQPADAAVAYQRALSLDRDLVEAHYNLGMLWLEQNKPAAAITEFTAYTLQHGNEPDGWLKLGSAQLHANDFLSAEKSFSTALNLSTNNAEALNGLGLARVERGRPREASQYFAAAIRYHPDYAPALLNLATVAHEHLHDDKLALENYRAYLALNPHPANWEAVNQIVKDMEQPAVVAAPPSPPPEKRTPSPQPEPARPPAEPKTQAVVRTTTPVKAKPGTSRPPAVLPPRQAISVPTQEVKVEPEPVIAATPGTPVTKISPSAVAQPQSDSYVQNGVTPLPRLGSIAPAGASQNSGSPSKSLPLVQSAPASFPRYHYLSPSKPSPGDRRAASGAFTRAQEYEQSSRWTYALEWYRRATQSDPGWFEAQYNYGVLAYRLRNYSASLTAYETALAIQPDSTDARYNFALALKAAGYAVDAVNELKKIVAANPGDVRSQLALGNLYAQQLREPAAARQHYLKVLELDPHNPQATDIRFWLSANPE